MTSEQMIEEAARAMFDCTAENWFLGPNAEWDEADEVQRDRWRVRARAALTVFEGAYTPTDDERSAIIDALLDELGWEWDEVPEEHIPSSREILGDMADRVLATVAGFHRTVQGEKPGEHGGTIPLYGMLDVWMALYGTSHPDFDEFYAEHGYAESWARLLAAVRERRTMKGNAKLPENSMQGEPTCRYCGRPMAEHPGGVYCPAGPVQGEPGLRAHVRNLTGATDAELDALGGFQGEPSDALRDAIDHIQGAVEFQDAINPEAIHVVIAAALRAAAETGGKHRGS